MCSLSMMGGTFYIRVYYRGVLDAGAHMGACMKPDEVFKPPSFEAPSDECSNVDYRSDKRQGTGRSGWLLGLRGGSNATNTNPTMSGTDTVNSSPYPLLHGVGKRYVKRSPQEHSDLLDPLFGLV